MFAWGNGANYNLVSVTQRLIIVSQFTRPPTRSLNELRAFVK